MPVLLDRKHKYALDAIALSSVPSSPGLPHQHKIPLSRRFGWYASLMLILGTFVLFGCVAFVSFLWMTDDASPTWTRIVLTGWVTRSITISTLVLRIIVSAQAMLATSMMAALMLNWFQVRLPNAAAVSLMRFSNAGPWDLLRHLPTQLSAKGAALCLLVVLLTATSLILQLSSTALLSDVGIGSMITPQVLSNIPYSISQSPPTQQLNNVAYHRVRPASHPAFAEYTEPANAKGGMRDTGLSIRAFLPINDTVARNNLVSYNGKATLLDTRVVCVKPEVSRIKVKALDDQPSISGWVRTDETNSDFWPLHSSKLGIPFNCTWALPGSQNLTNSYSLDWALALCSIGELEDDLEIQSPITTATDNLAFLLINATGSSTDWDPINKAGGKFSVTKTSAEDEWVWLGNSNANTAIKMTFCMGSKRVMDKSIVASRQAPVDGEATASWVNQNATFNTLDIRKQLGATAATYSPEQRAIFSLDNPMLTNKSISLEDYSTPSLLYSAAFTSDALTANHSIYLCKYCQPASLDETAGFHSDIFRDIMTETGNPALAIQSFITTIFSMAYYDHFYQFDSTTAADLSTRISVIKPTGIKYFCAFLAIVGCHIILVLVSALMFAFSSPTTMLGNAWSAVSQLRAPETEGWLVMASNLSDGQLSSAMKETHKESVYVGVSSEGQELYIRRKRGVFRQ